MQSAHAAIAFCAGRRVDADCTLILLCVRHEEDLRALIMEADYKGIALAAFREPDLGGCLTAVALGADGRRLVRHLPLTLSAGEGVRS